MSTNGSNAVSRDDDDSLWVVCLHAGQTLVGKLKTSAFTGEPVVPKVLEPVYALQITSMPVGFTPDGKPTGFQIEWEGHCIWRLSSWKDLVIGDTATKSIRDFSNADQNRILVAIQGAKKEAQNFRAHDAGIAVPGVGSAPPLMPGAKPGPRRV